MPGAVVNQDQDMADAPTEAGAEAGAMEVDHPELEDDDDTIRLKILQGATETAASFEFAYEDHTLGNALRYVIAKNPDVEFCGYSIPHPSEAKMHLRIQTFDDVNVQDVLDKGLKDLMDLCDVVVEKFTEARDKFNASKQ
ncbi:DNA-directed RNA polymerase I and III 14 KDA polypeptide [Aulographum hederae CBS 113979]|uniref:DNA-directed RNA polymerases I and III subunit RPAC2 n=1 Tax=Aulographum hederae CBS 113979 TaxID=1176131 RepID=A0A6G1GR59_9PEZI|nr:DNA-directed RNA polymerase I and III 14 KDA polypeptide [Aulographum hederae CBS 113979]